MPWDPILKLYLLNSSTCRSREQCTGPTKKKKNPNVQSNANALLSKPNLKLFLFYYGCLIGGMFFFVLNSYYFLPLSSSLSGSLSHNKSTRSVGL